MGESSTAAAGIGGIAKNESRKCAPGAVGTTPDGGRAGDYRWGREVSGWRRQWTIYERCASIVRDLPLLFSVV